MRRGSTALVCVCTALLACKPTGDSQPIAAERAASTAAAADHPLSSAEVEALKQAGATEDLTLDDDTTSAPVGKPNDYGVFRTPLPPPSAEQLTHHALAGYEVVAIYGEPSMSAEKLGFLRLGQRLQVSARISDQECVKGWHHLANGGFACASKGLVVEAKPPYMKFPPHPPRLAEPFPYEWAYVRKFETPMWWRFPTDEEYRKTASLRSARDRTRAAIEAMQPSKEGSAAGSGLPNVNTSQTNAQWGIDGLGTPANPTSLPTLPTMSAEELAAQSAGLPLSPGLPWLEKGFFLSLDEAVEDSGRRYFRTSRGGYVDAHDVSIYGAKDFHGQVIDDTMNFPLLGFIMAKEAPSYELDAQDRLQKKGIFERKTFVAFKEERDIRGEIYVVSLDGRVVKKSQVRQPEPANRPAELLPWDHWIDVDLSRQMLVAYEGDRAVYVTLISSGKPGTTEEPFDTPNGTYRIYSKQVTSNMDGTTATDGAYAIQDVPWVMYFHQSYALHGAFWHQSFGYVRSHGCVNLGPSDARWLFHWTTPQLPSGWHGVHASTGNAGTMVVIRGLPPGREKDKERG